MLAVKIAHTFKSRIFLKNVGQRCIMSAIKPMQEPDMLRLKWPRANFNVEKMTELLDHDNHEMRKELRKFLSDPIFTPKYDTALIEEREVSQLDWCGNLI